MVQRFLVVEAPPGFGLLFAAQFAVLGTPVVVGLDKIVLVELAFVALVLDRFVGQAFAVQALERIVGLVAVVLVLGMIVAPAVVVLVLGMIVAKLVLEEFWREVETDF